MADLSIDYLGLKLKNPIIVGSSGLTSSVKKIKGLEENGAGAIVLKSIFEEEIAYEYEDFIKKLEKQALLLNTLIMMAAKTRLIFMITKFERTI